MCGRRRSHSCRAATTAPPAGDDEHDSMDFGASALGRAGGRMRRLSRRASEPTPVGRPRSTTRRSAPATRLASAARRRACRSSSASTGPGYVQRVARRFKSEGKTVTLNNLGVPGAVLSPAVQAIGNSVGLEIFRNVLTDEAPNVRRSSTLVTVFIGANDANAIGRAVRAGLGGPDIVAYGQAHIQNFARDMKTFVSIVRGRAPTARIVALNLPNMANTPYAAASDARREAVPAGADRRVLGRHQRPHGRRRDRARPDVRRRTSTTRRSFRRTASIRTMPATPTWLIWCSPRRTRARPPRRARAVRR